MENERSINATVKSEYVQTNIGKIPVEEYRDIAAMQRGFDDYEDMYNQGYRFGNKYDIGG